jgi:hypothetical protein
MRKAGQMVVVTMVLCLLAGSAFGQSLAPTQISLKKLEKIYVEIQPNSLSPQTHEKFSSLLTLELRKAGLRIAKEKNEVDPSKDGVIVVAFNQLDRPLSQDMSLEWVLIQRATLARTGEALPLITWRHFDDRRGIIPRDVAEPMLRMAIDKFLNSWLSANGR